MVTELKIRIIDHIALRKEIDKLYDMTDQIILAKWSISIAKHILELLGVEYNSVFEIRDGFKVNEMWQSGKASVHDVRQSGFEIHRLARETEDEIKKTALRVVGQAVSSGHMGEHSMVASDYAVKVVGLITKNDIDAITNERKWQLKELNRIRDDK